MTNLMEEMVKLSPEEREVFADRLFFDMWGVTKSQFWQMSASEIEAIAQARGLTVAGIAKGGTYHNEGDGEDHRN